ncbi:MAG: hypothetical protein MI796_14370 [Enterobacterales bacterium]|nr:hypothetical protein [Enterobacterales bacterium]
MKQSSTGRYLVKPHNPWQQWTWRCLGVALILAMAWGAFEFGIVRGGHNRAAANVTIDRLNNQVEMLGQQIDELMLENAQLVSDKAIESTASEQVSVSLRELNDETLELKEELMFYRSLLSPADLEPGLQILGVKLIKSIQGSAYDYKVVLTQRRNNSRFAKGRIQIAVNGIRNEENVALQTTDILEVGGSELDFRFKNFQSLEGQIRLPENFVPQEVLITAVPVRGSLKKVERNYEWSSIVSGG